ncbi:MAG TPA: iron-containing alcohol dehydrogenase [Candidatus Sumerlaeota bacterium]|nr:iron-containing alcohol dehydrogenase [Candidatus Sumerlaeota bacterium]HPS01645.1 iron-containing alcohol dehydrogenase [Candidatus Sumerlaeota bacterium]
MFEIRKFVAPEFIFGNGAMDLVARYARNFGARKPLIVTDPGVIAAGWPGKVIEVLEKADLEYSVFSEVNSNPRDAQAMAGAEFYREQGCDAIIAVGGGSPMDCAKAIGIVGTNRMNVLEFEGVDNVPEPGPPLICIPTTAGTSADVSQFAIINDCARKVKIAIISKTVVPDVALIDPVTTSTMDPYLTACTGMDALVHAIEAVVSTANSPIMDIHALAAIRLIRENLPAVMQNPQDLELRGRMMLGSLEAGLAFSNASLGAVHAMAHGLGGLLDMPHGECNALLLNSVIAFNHEAALERYDRVGEALGLDFRGLSAAEKLRHILDEISGLKASVGITATLNRKGVKSSDLAQLAENALHDPCMVTNPRRPTQRDIEVVYEEAM